MTAAFNPKRSEEMKLTAMLERQWETDTKQMMTGQQGIDKMKARPPPPRTPPAPPSPNLPLQRALPPCPAPLHHRRSHTPFQAQLQGPDRPTGGP